MRKIRLEIEHLAVESFATAPAADGKGTVHGRSDPNACYDPGGGGGSASCGGTCDWTCPATCNPYTGSPPCPEC